MNEDLARRSSYYPELGNPSLQLQPQPDPVKKRSKNCRPHLCPHAARVGGVLSYRSVKGSGNTSVVPARLVAYLATSATGTK